MLEFFTLGKSFTLWFEMFRFNSATRTWTNEGAFTALMTWTPAPAGYPSSNDDLTGEAKNSSGTVVGKLTMGWVRNNPGLQSPFAYFEAKRLAEGFGQRKANLKAAAALIDDSTVMSPAEIKKAATLVKAEKRDSESAKSLVKTLRSKANVRNGDAEIREMLAAL